jgi:hypothetical protein
MTCRLRALTFIGLISCAVGSVSVWPVSAQVNAGREADIKAGFLYNFARFIEWPQDAFNGLSDPLRIELIGRDPFDGRLDQILAGKMVNNRPIRVIYSLSGDALPSGHIVVVSVSETKRLTRLLEECRHKPIVTVSDIDGFVEAGGIIGFVTDNQRIRFAISNTTAEQQHLHVDSRVLSLALLVDGKVIPGLFTR